MRLLSLTFALLCSAQVLLAQPEKELEKANEDLESFKFEDRIREEAIKKYIEK